MVSHYAQKFNCMCENQHIIWLKKYSSFWYNLKKTKLLQFCQGDCSSYPTNFVIKNELSLLSQKSSGQVHISPAPKHPAT